MTDNPYEPPAAGPSQPSPRRALPTRRRVAIAILILLTPVAMFAAFFATCLTTFGILGLDHSYNWPPLVGFLFAAITALAMIVWIARLRRPPSPSHPSTHRPPT